MEYKEIELSRKAKDLRGQKFGRLVALKPIGKMHRAIVWLCKCRCGNEATFRAGALLSGKYVSCGCKKYESRPNLAARTHGRSKTPEWHTWTHIRQRCGNPNDSNYHNYGGRGIRVCKRWDESFEAFYEDMGKRPKGKSLDRIDNDGDYSPENCRWATPRQQAFNRRDCVMLTYKGETMPLGRWAARLGFKDHTLRNRLRWNWSVERAIETPERNT